MQVKTNFVLTEKDLAKLKLMQTLRFIELRALHTHRGICWFPDQELAQLVRVNRKTISRYLDELEQKNLITRFSSSHKEGTRLRWIKANRVFLRLGCGFRVPKEKRKLSGVPEETFVQWMKLPPEFSLRLPSPTQLAIAGKYDLSLDSEYDQLSDLIGVDPLSNKIFGISEDQNVSSQ